MEADTRCEPLVMVHVGTVVALIGVALTRAVCHSPRAPVSALAGPGDGHTLPVLARREMWRGDVMVGGLTQLHLAASFALVAVCLIWPALFGQGNACSSPEDLWEWKGCRNQVAAMGGIVASSLFAVN